MGIIELIGIVLLCGIGCYVVSAVPMQNFFKVLIYGLVAALLVIAAFSAFGHPIHGLCK